MTIDKQVIESKFAEMAQYLKELEPILHSSASDIVSDYTKLRTVERNFQLIVDTVLAINTHLIAAQSLTPSEDYQSTFAVLAENHILPKEFSQKISPVVGLRNKIVHQYGDIDRKQFIEDLKTNLDHFSEYIALIKRFIEQK